MSDFALVFLQSTDELVVLQTTEILKKHHFDCKQVKYGKDIILLIEQKDTTLILQTLATLKLEKPKYSKLKDDTNTIDHNNVDKKQRRYDLFRQARQNIDPKVGEMELYSKFKYVSRHKFLRSNNNQNDEVVLQEVFSPAEREMAVYQILANIALENLIRDLFSDNERKHDFLLIYLKKKGVLRDMCPLSRGQSALYDHNALLGCLNVASFLDTMVHQTCAQFGEQVAMYFHFVRFLISQMWYLAIAGLITFILDEAFDEDINTSPFESFYAMLAVIWGSVFVGLWIKQQNKLRVTMRCRGRNFVTYEHTINMSLIKSFQHDDQEMFQKNKEFETEESERGLVDPVTGLKLIHSGRRLWRIYATSALKSLPYLTAVFGFLLISLNTRGYTVQQHYWLYIPYLASLSDTGAIFDKNSWRANITTILHVIGVQIINSLYREVSMETSLQEQHLLFHHFESSIIIKRFAFEMLSGFTDFFYIGFVRCDILALKIEILSMFMFDEVRRAVTETLIPSFQKMSLWRSVRRALTTTNQVELQDRVVSVYLPKYESFDDYLEIVLNFGYVMFFTSAYPFASIVVLIFLVIEFLSDHYKVNHLYQKPLSLKTKGIGPWSGAMDMICIISVFSNLILFAFASDKIAELFPSLFIDSAHHSIQVNQNTHQLLMAQPLPGKGSYMVLIVFIIEHFLFISMWLSRVYIQNKKDWTNIYQSRKEYKMRIKSK